MLYSHAMPTYVMNEVKDAPIYTLDDFSKIKNGGFDYVIDDDTHDIIQALAEEVGAPTYVRTPVFSAVRVNKHEKHGGRKKKRHTEMSDDDWTAIRNFHTRDVNKVLDSTQVTIGSFRTIMNKLTESNEVQQREALLETYEQNAGMSCFNHEMVMKEFFRLAWLSSQMNPALTSRVYCVIASNIDEQVMKETLSTAIMSWRNSFDAIEYADENKDYAAFCKANENNDERVKIGKFLMAVLITLRKNDNGFASKTYVDLQESFEQILEELVERMKESGETKSMRYFTDEYGKNIDGIYSIWNTMSGDVMVCNMSLIYNGIYEIVNGQYPGISGKTRFLMMAILDDSGYDGGN